MTKIYAHLARIQREIKAPKNQFNSFGNYKYRNAEDILSAFKEVADGCSVILSDKIVVHRDQSYVEATATLLHPDCEDVVTVTALAREPENKKGMDAAQITGATSSYARKYALNGLFAIDDSKDADSMPSQGQTSSRTGNKSPQKISEAQVKRFYAAASANGWSHEQVKAKLAQRGLESAKDLTVDRYDAAVEFFTVNKPEELINV